jgi:hypothetical protein
MTDYLTKLIDNEGPRDRFERVFWHLDKINSQRSDDWPLEYLELSVRELSDLLEELYTEWLKASGAHKAEKDLSQYLFFVMPYVSFRLLNSPPSKAVDIFKASSTQKKRFLDCMAEELHELPDNPLVRALMKESLKTLLTFLEGLKLRREQ